MEKQVVVDATSDTTRRRGEMHISRPTEGTLLVHLSGSCMLQSDRPAVAELRRPVDTDARAQHLTFETSGLTNWDSGLVTFLRNVEELCRSRQISLDRNTLPDGIRRLLELAAAGRAFVHPTSPCSSKNAVPRPSRL